MSVDASQIKEIIRKDGYPAMFQAYENRPLVYPRITEVLDVPAGFYGEKMSVYGGLGDLKRVRDGEELQADTVPGTPWQMYLAVRRYGGRVDLPQKMLDAADAIGKVQNLISEFSKQWGRRAPAQKEQLVADVFQKGTLSAGDKTVFDGTFDNQVEIDANPGLIFDGKPFFAATGNGHPLKGGSSTPFNLTASRTLTQANIQSCMTTMRTTNAIDERERKILIIPNVLLVPPGLEFDAKVILNSTQVSGAANNDINPIRGSLDPIVWDYLTDDTDAWWLGAVGQGGGVRVRDSGAPKLEHGYDPKTKVHYVTAEFEFGVHVQDWRQWYANNKATS